MCSVETCGGFCFYDVCYLEAYVIVYDCVALWNVLLLAWRYPRRVLLLRFFMDKRGTCRR